MHILPAKFCSLCVGENVCGFDAQLLRVIEIHQFTLPKISLWAAVTLIARLRIETVADLDFQHDSEVFTGAQLSQAGLQLKYVGLRPNKGIADDVSVLHDKLARPDPLLSERTNKRRCRVG